MSRSYRWQSVHSVGECGGEPVVRVSEIEITEEPIHIRGLRLPKEVEERVQELVPGARERPREMVPLLEGLVAKYPKTPQLRNWLAVAYESAGQHEKYEQTVVENYRQNPKYLFARVSYAEMLLRRGEVEKVPAVFGGKMDLGAMYPERKRFHVTEFLSFAAVLAMYLMEVGEEAAAGEVYDTMREIAPGHPTVKQMRRILYPGPIGKLSHVLRRWAERQGEKKGA